MSHQHINIITVITFWEPLNYISTQNWVLEQNKKRYSRGKTKRTWCCLCISLSNSLTTFAHRAALKCTLIINISETSNPYCLSFLNLHQWLCRRSGSKGCEKDFSALTSTEKALCKSGCNLTSEMNVPKILHIHYKFIRLSAKIEEQAQPNR